MASFTKTSPGKKVGARKVDADEYMPKPGDWEETNILWKFDDGWLVCDNLTEYDRRLTAALTLTCVAGLIPRCLPFDEFGWEVLKREQLTKVFDTAFAREEQGDNFDAWLEQRVKLALMEERGKRYHAGQPCFKIAHVRDPEQRPRCCILMVLWEALDPKFRGRYGSINYGDSDDFGQPHPLIIDGLEWKLLEARIGTGFAPPKIIEPYIVEWYKSSTGQWDEDAYQAALKKRKNWTAYENHETEQKMAKYRRPSLVTA